MSLGLPKLHNPLFHYLNNTTWSILWSLVLTRTSPQWSSTAWLQACHIPTRRSTYTPHLPVGHFIHSLTRDGQNPEDVLKCLFIQLKYTVSMSEQVFIYLNRGCMDSSHKVRGYGRAVDSVSCLQILRIMDGYDRGDVYQWYHLCKKIAIDSH